MLVGLSTARVPGGSTSTTTPGTTITPPTRPEDVDAPKVGGLTARPATIWTAETGGGNCSTAMPTETTIAVSAADPSGTTAVVLDLGGAVERSFLMEPVGGDTYRATVGPFADGTVPRGGSGKVELTVTATDRAGNEATATGSFTLTDCPA